MTEFELCSCYVRPKNRGTQWKSDWFAVTSALLACGVMLLAGCMSGDAARASIKWDVILTIAAAFGISKAMENTGARLAASCHKDQCLVCMG